ncbi:MAG: hypothetical protein Q8Q60_00635 [Candidatus Chromulinivorax sp.]|nr:hypothetical protein [Candidatus Chromulinivorax sp.]
MKKLESLQILILMSLSLGSSCLYSKKINNINDQKEAIQFQLTAERGAHRSLEVLQDLAVTNPESVSRIIKFLAKLETTLDSVESLLRVENKEIEKLLGQDSVQQEKAAELAVELAEIQEALTKTLAEERANHRHNFKKEHLIKNALMKAQQGVKRLNDMAANGIRQAQQSLSKIAHRGGVRKKQAALAAAEIPGVQDAVAENLAERNNIPVEQAHTIIDNALSNDEDEEDEWSWDTDYITQKIAEAHNISIEEAKALLDKFTEDNNEIHEEALAAAESPTAKEDVAKKLAKIRNISIEEARSAVDNIIEVEKKYKIYSDDEMMNESLPLSNAVQSPEVVVQATQTKQRPNKLSSQQQQQLQSRRQQKSSQQTPPQGQQQSSSSSQQQSGQQKLQSRLQEKRQQLPTN